MKSPAATQAIAPSTPEKGIVAVLTDLVKARLTSLVLLTTMVGFYAGSRQPVDSILMAHAMLGTCVLACGAAALNQLLERNYDALMRRTESRALPSGRLTPDQVLLFGGSLSAFGLVYLAFLVNPLTAFLGAITLVSYLFVYTPLKRRTTLNTAIGAIPGALPPLMGWTAAQDTVSIQGWSLFAILFFWQLPHFLAIAWIYREDYARGGFKMLPLVDEDGGRTGRQALSHSLGLLPVSLFPSLLGLTGSVYFVGALILGIIFVGFAFRFSRARNVRSARALFIVSIIYLPLLLGLLVFDKLK